jgi:hypothetical protein
MFHVSSGGEKGSREGKRFAARMRAAFDAPPNDSMVLEKQPICKNLLNK